MRRTPALVVLLALVAGGAALLLLRHREPSLEISSGEEPLEPLVQSPRPPVEAEPPRATLRGRPPPERKAIPEGDRAALLRERNELAREHRRMVEFHAAGRVSMQDVEEAEMRLLDARRRLGELDRPTWHRARAVLIARAAERTHLLVEAGVLPAPELQRVRLALERERLLAGDDNAYATNRDGFLAATKDGNALRVAAGFASAKSLEEEYERLESEFATADAARAQDR